MQEAVSDSWVVGSRSQVGQRQHLLVRRDTPVWPFIWRGLLPLLGLLGLLLYAVWPFARGEIEANVERSIAQAFADKGLPDVRVQVFGQQVLLGGSLKPGVTPLDALAIAKQATCPTWLGPQVCAELVIGKFESSPAAPSVPNLPSPKAATAPATTAEDQACEKTLAEVVERQSIQFFSGSARLTPDSRAVLDRVAEAHAGCKGVVRVEGHTDNIGNDTSNQRLSLARAQAVRDELVKRGIAADRLQAEGFGPKRPLADNTVAQGRRLNRRIEFKVIATQ